MVLIFAKGDLFHNKLLYSDFEPRDRVHVTVSIMDAARIVNAMQRDGYVLLACAFAPEEE